MTEMSRRQRAILDFISLHCAEQGYPPTVREIGSAVGLASPSTVHAHLARLEASGHIRRDPTKPRAMLVHKGRAAAPSGLSAPSAPSLPLVGAVAASALRLAEQEVEDWVSCPFAGDFVLKVTGDSMCDAGILDGDMVVVRKQETALDGEIVVALVGEEATVKRLRREGRSVMLMPENPAYEPIVPADEVRVLGRVVGVLRSL